MVHSTTVSGLVADIVLILLGALAAFICLVPMWHTLMSSISDPFSLLSHSGIVLYPIGGVTLDGYIELFSDNGILIGYANTIIYVVGTVGLGFVIDVVAGYCMSRQSKLKGGFMLFFLFPMMFSGGMIPTYMVVNALGLVNTRAAVILLECTNVMNIVIGMNAFNGVPESTVEAAKMEGAGHITIMFRVMLPQCMNLFAVTILLSLVASWNSWLNAQIYVGFDRDKWPLQLWIQQIVADNENVLNSANPNYAEYLVQFCVIIAATLPIIIIFPFFQKQFEKGAMLGAVKG